jgi:predicted lipoprotein with Yx(FWY)xxD motif
MARKSSRLVMTGIAVASAGLITACGSAASSQAPAAGRSTPASPGIVSTRSLPGIGTVLVNRSGKTIYTPQQEADGKISCTGGCLSFWFPVTVPPGTALRDSGGVTGVLGTVHGAGGLTQLTYDGLPLYTFRLDGAPGQVHGNDYTDHFGGDTFTWHAVTTAGAASGPGQPAPAASYSYQGGSSGY